METIGNSHWYTYAAFREATDMMHTSSVSAAAPTGPSRRPRALDGAGDRHGRHKNALPAPSSRPLDRVNVLRYSALFERCPWSADISAINDNAATRQPTPRRRWSCVRIDMIATNTNGQIRYHCSSTASDQRCRSSGGSAEVK